MDFLTTELVAELVLGLPNFAAFVILAASLYGLVLRLIAHNRELWQENQRMTRHYLELCASSDDRGSEGGTGNVTQERSN